MSNDILDYISNNWQQLLGVDPAQTESASPVRTPQAPGAGGPPPLTSQQQAQFNAPNPPPLTPDQSQQFSPSGVMDVNALQPNMPPDWTSMPNVAGGRGLDPSVQSPTAAAAPAPGAPSLGPAPQDAFGSLNSQPYVGPSLADAFGSMPDGSTGTMAPGSPPSSAVTAAPAAPTGAPAPAPAPMTSQDFARRFGLDPSMLRTANPPPQMNTLQNVLAGIGKGMSAVGAQPAGTNAGASFAAGLGGGITGGLNEMNQQEQQIRQAKNDLFSQSSGAFKDMLAAKNQDDTEAYRTAQGAYLNARAKALQLGGNGKTSGAWQNTDYGKVIQVENEAQKYEKGQQILLQKRWTLNGTPPDQQQADLDRLQKNVETYKSKLYQSAGVDPNKGEKMKDWGVSKDNPFETKGMTLDQFNEQVPMGAWYTDQNGTARQRTVPPGGFNAPAGNAAPQSNNTQTSAQPNYDDMQAMMQASPA